MSEQAPPPYANDFPFEEAEDEGGFDARRYIAAVLRHKWLILGLSVLGLLGGAGISQIVQPVYSAQATIAITQASRGESQSPIRNSQLLQSRAWLDLLRSFYVLDEVVLRRRLFIETQHPEDATHFADLKLGQMFSQGVFRVVGSPTGNEVTLTDATGVALDRAAPGDSLGRAVGLAWLAPRLAPGQVVNFTVRPPRDAAIRLEESLETILPPDNAAFLRLAMRGNDPEMTAETLNAIADRFVEVATLLKRERLTGEVGILREQLASSLADLRRAERDLETFRVGTITLPSERGATQIAPGLAETRDPVRNAFFQLRIDRDALVRDRDAIRRALTAGRDSGALLLVSLGSVPAVLPGTELSASLATLASKRAEARALSIAFTSAHPPLARLEREIAELESQTIPVQAGALVANLEQRIRDFDDRISSSSREMQQIPTRSADQTRLERDLEIAQSLYTQLRSSYEAANLAERNASPDVRVLDRAVPPSRPMRDQLLFIVAGGLAAGFGLGLALALVMDRLDRRLRYPDQVTRDLGLTILGALPLVRNGKDGQPVPDDSAHLTEALRSVRMSLVYAHGAAGTFVTTVTSPGPGDGKSFVCRNLARTFANSGHRTLLIDGDTRRGFQHRSLGLSRRPGLLDYLGGASAREQIIQKSPTWGFDFIGCGTRSGGGPELLGSSAMAQLVMAMRAEYSVVIIDSPPLGAGVDAMVLAALGGTMVMVLRTGVTDRELAEARLHDVHRLPIRVLGAILNDVKAEGIYRYYSYLDGYRAEDEVTEGTHRSPRRTLLKGG